MALFAATPAWASSTDCPTLLDHHFKRLGGGKSFHLCEAFRGKVLLVVNTASYCAYTPHYKGLQTLADTYRARGLVVLGFPSNDFGGQEPGSAEQIRNFCEKTYQVEFPMFEKTSVKRPGGNPLFDALAQATGERPQWNFHKYLVSRDGRQAQSFASQVDPQDPRLVRALETLLAAPAP